MIEFKQTSYYKKFQSYNFKKYVKYYLLNMFEICYSKFWMIVNWNGDEGEYKDGDDDEEELGVNEAICRFSWGIINRGGKFCADNEVLLELLLLTIPNLPLLTYTTYLKLLIIKCR